MAAMPETPGAELLELSRVRVRDLDPLLEEETAVWKEELNWDFQASADLVRRFVDVQALSGYALFVSGELSGYSYFVAEEHKGLIGDLYVMKSRRTPDHECRLMTAVVDGLMQTRHVRRIESQLMLFERGPRPPLPRARFLNAYDRNFMVLDAKLARTLAPRNLGGAVLFDQWSERRQEETAQLIAASYRSHIDSEINDQYRSVAGARRFLFNIVQYPGCGLFFPPASWIAVRSETGRVCGVCLSSMVAADIGHITQICVSPGVKGTGIGYELMRRSLESLARYAVKKISLTVTAANTEAVQLYERMGFRTVRQFPALVWDGF